MEKTISDRLQAHLHSQLDQHFGQDAFFVLGVSGGPDSMALMYLFYLLKQDVLIVHVNYGKRGEESDQDQELTEQMAFAWGFECCSIRLNPKDAGNENFQNWARKQRYQFFEDLKADFNADAIVTAHHQNDQVETIFQKILRGSSPAAWKGMEIWDERLFRPLLPFSKEEILGFCEAEAIPYRIDASNEESGFARNFIRNELAEQMDALFPGWRQNLLALEDHAQAFDEGIKVVADLVMAGDALDVHRFSDLSDALKPAVLKFILDEKGAGQDYSKGELKELVELESLQTGKSRTVAGFTFARDRDQILIHASSSTPELNAQITHQEMEASGWANDQLSLNVVHRQDAESDLSMDLSTLSFPLTLRNWKAGDQFQPLGMGGHQKISDHLTNRKIPTISREKALVLCGSDSTIYAIIYPVESPGGAKGSIADHVKITAATQNILSINIS